MVLPQRTRLIPKKNSKKNQKNVSKKTLANSGSTYVPTMSQLGGVRVVGGVREW